MSVTCSRVSVSARLPQRVVDSFHFCVNAPPPFTPEHDLRACYVYERLTTFIMKPFRAPTFVRPDSTNGEPPLKKRRVSSDHQPSSDAVIDRKPLIAVQNPAPSPSVPNNGDGNYYTVLWRKYTTKKNKTWDGDGVLAVVGGHASLTDSDTGKEMGRGACNRPLLPGSALSIGGKEIEIDGVIEKADYLAGRMFLGMPLQHLRTRRTSRTTSRPLPATNNSRHRCYRIRCCLSEIRQSHSHATTQTCQMRLS
jgi:hypothetical protein